jgi:sodium-dependent phosphate transporter
MLATHWGMPVSTTQTVVGALVGAGFASQAPIKWKWESGSVSQVAASWLIAPLLAGAFSALIFGTVKYSVLERKDPFKNAMRLIPFYFAMTGAILALFIVVEAPTAPSLEEFGAGNAAGIILGVFFGCLAICYVFFIPFFKRKLIMKDPRVRIWHVVLGPLLLKESTTLFWPGKGNEYVTDYYEDAFGEVHAGTNTKHAAPTSANHDDMKKSDAGSPSGSTNNGGLLPSDPEKTPVQESSNMPVRKLKKPEPYERWIVPVKHLSWVNPQKWWAYTKFVLLRGVSCDVITHDNDLLRAVHSKAIRYDVRVEHLWTYCQVVSAMMMSIAHGSNDVANAVGPWAAVYQTFRAGEVATRSPTPVWFLIVAGLLLGLGFWLVVPQYELYVKRTNFMFQCRFYGYHIVRALGNKITQMSPTRGYSVELGAAITVLLASRLGLPVSTTQCLTGSAVGVALMNYDLGAVNWRQLAFIFSGWVSCICHALTSHR